jgi:hypothetical protein
LDVARGITIIGLGITVLRVVIICVSFVKQVKLLPACLVQASSLGMWIPAVGIEAFGNEIDADVAT